MSQAAKSPAGPAKATRQVDRNSLLLLLMLTVPAGIMAVVLFIWPQTQWVAPIPHTATGILGAFAAVLLSTSILARFRSAWLLYASAGLMSMGVLTGFQAVSTPGSPESAWLYMLAQVFGGVFFLIYALAETRLVKLPRVRPTGRSIAWLIGAPAGTALLAAVLTAGFTGSLPAVTVNGGFTAAGIALNAAPALLFLLAGALLFRHYRRTGSREHFLLTAILIFLFQAAEVFSFATPWSVIWWFWQGLRMLVYLAVLIFVVTEAIDTAVSLRTEVRRRRRTESALRAAELRWRESFNALAEVMAILRPDYTIENINSRGLALLGQPREQVIGRKCFQAIHGESEPCEFCPFTRTLQTRQAESVERFDEVYDRHFRIKSVPILNERGEVTMAVYSMSDITAQVQNEARQKALEQELNRTSRLASIGRVVAGITHEINNPLTGVIAFAQMLMQSDIPEPMREAVEVIHDGATRVVGIVDKLLTFARRDRPEKEYADINSILTNTLAMRSYEMRVNSIEVTTHLAHRLPRTMANVGQLQQVFLNIIINAEQAMTAAGGHGELVVSTEAVNGNIRTTISDTGPGIPPDIQDKLFDPFFTTKDQTGGTGLGLSISYGIVKEHGGEIHVSSAPGKGATFIVDIPVVAEAGDSQPQPPATPARPKTTPPHRARILVVDDEPHICRALNRLLSREGHEVATTTDPKAALALLAERHYDLLLLDLKMPAMNGIELYHQAEKADPGLHERVICITGDVISPQNREFLRQNRLPFVTKPFGVKELLDQVRTALEKKERRGEKVTHTRG